MDWTSDWWVDALTWILVLVGIVGTIFPMLPGQLLILSAAVLNWWLLKDESSLSLWTFLVLSVIYLIGQLGEIASGAIGSRWFGGTKWGMMGAGLGALVGIFFFPWGIIVGPVTGAFLAERFVAKKEVNEATRAGVGSAIGAVAGLGLGFVAGLVMAAYLLVDRYFF